MMSILEATLELPLVYRLWQAPFAHNKLMPLRRHNDLRAVRRVLDVGCGPGTNAQAFGGASYCGIDINPKYVEYAKRHCRGTFVVGDAADLHVDHSDKFDCVLINSLLHHLPDASVDSLFQGLRGAVAASGSIHVLELVRPSGNGIDAMLARADRGQFSRTVEQWVALLNPHLDLQIVEPYSLGKWGLLLWNMVYVRGTPRC